MNCKKFALLNRGKQITFKFEVAKDGFICSKGYIEGYNDYQCIIKIDEVIKDCYGGEYGVGLQELIQYGAIGSDDVIFNKAAMNLNTKLIFIEPKHITLEEVLSKEELTILIKKLEL